MGGNGCQGVHNDGSCRMTSQILDDAMVASVSGARLAKFTDSRAKKDGKINAGEMVNGANGIGERERGRAGEGSVTKWRGTF